MKFSTVIVSALAAVVSAAPAKTQIEERTVLDPSLVNNFVFGNQNFNYLSQINSFNFDIINQLVTVNNFDVSIFQSLFASQIFDINALIQLQQIQTLIQFQQLGVLSSFDLATLQLQTLNLGLLGPIGTVDLSSFFLQGSNSLVSVSDINQISTIAQSQTSVVIGK